MVGPGEREDAGRVALVRGLVPPRRATPRRLARLALISRRQGRTIAGLVAAAAIRDGRAVALVDDDGALTYEQLETRAATVAGELHGRGVLHAGHRIGVLCRNGRGLVVTMVAASHLGADVVMLTPTADGTSLAAQLRDEHLHVVAADEAFVDTLAAARFRGTTILADRSAPGQLNVRDLELLPQAALPRPDRPGRILIATDSDRGDGTTEIGPLGAHRLPILRGSSVLILAPLTQQTGLQAWAAAVVQECPALLTPTADGAETAALTITD